MAKTRRPRTRVPAPRPLDDSVTQPDNELREKDRNDINTDTPAKRKRRSRRDRARDPSQAPRPAYPSAATLLAHLPDIRGTVTGCGVPRREIEEVTATCLVAAWAAIQRGEFRVHAWVDMEEALRRWLYGIAWRLSAHERGRARHRCEILTADPWEFAASSASSAGGLPEPAADPEGQILARAALRALDALPADQRKLLLELEAGAATSELAAQLGISTRAVLLRIERARLALAILMEETW